MGRALLALLSRDRLDEDTWEEIEDTLITADVGVAPTQELVERLRTRMRVEGVEASSAATVLHEELLALVDPTMDRRIAVTGADGKPGVVLVVGVNGSGKTTSVGKLARVLVAQDKTVVLGAADTFRAAATEQLSTWGERVGVDVVTGPEGSDPASVAFESVRTGVERGVDVVVVDTAGRLQNKAGLMDELGKVKRVVEKQAPVTEVLLVLDATTGQNGLVQARVFRDVVDVTGIVLTKLDGSAKGGIVVAVQRELGVPVKLVGVGEGADDLAPVRPRDVRRGAARRVGREAAEVRRLTPCSTNSTSRSSSSVGGISWPVTARIETRLPRNWTTALDRDVRADLAALDGPLEDPRRTPLRAGVGLAVERGDALVAHRLLDRGPDVVGAGR